MKKFTWCFLAMAALATSSHADEVTVTGRTASGRFTYACNAPDVTADLSDMLRTPRHDPQMEIALQQKGSCVGYTNGTRLSVISESVSSGGQPVALVKDVANQFPDLYVLKSELVAFTPEDLAQRAAASCGPGVGGEVDRWVLAKDGTLKLKRYMVTSKCVNGQMRSFTRPLN